MTLLLCLNLIAELKVIPLDDPQDMLNSISKHAIKIGSGTNGNVYVFVDPLCPYSRKLMRKINETQILKSENTYYIFLYELKKLNSNEFIEYIYQSEDPRSTLLNIMVDKDDFIDFEEFEATKKTLKTIDKVTNIAKRLKIKKRPYLISFEKGSKFCRVSEGNATCIENDFNE